MKFKDLLNRLPVVVFAVMGCLYLALQWQHWQTGRQGFDGPENSTSTPGELSYPRSESAEVIDVHDGDTLTVKQGWQRVKVRLCGIDAPELGQPLGRQSREYLRGLIARAGQLPGAATGNRVTLYGSDRDRYGRLVAEVFIPAPTPEQPEQERLLNYEQVAAGMAYRYGKYARKCPNGDSLLQAETEAQRQHRGVWAQPQGMKPWDYRKVKK